MNLCPSDATAGKTNAGNSFEFPPSSRTVAVAQPHNFTNSPTDSNRFYILNRANDFKAHQC